MKKLLITVLFLLFATHLWAANVEIKDLTDVSATATTSILVPCAADGSQANSGRCTATALKTGLALTNSVSGPATNTDATIPQWNGANSKLLKDGLTLDTDCSAVSASDDSVCSAKTTKAQLDLKLTTPTHTGGNCVVGYNSTGTDGTLGCFTTIQMDDSAAQFYNAASPTKLVKIDPSNQGAGQTGTIQAPVNGTFTAIAGTMTALATTSPGTGVATALAANANGTGGFVTDNGTAVLTNKTFDSTATGNVLKQTKYIYLQAPTRCDETGATLQTSDKTKDYFGQCAYSASAAYTANFAKYIFTVPEDIDTSVAMTIRFKFRLGGADTGNHCYVADLDSVANSAAYAGTFGPNHAVNLGFTGDGSGADGDAESVTGTLTNWAGHVTAGQLMTVIIGRDGGNENDGSCGTGAGSTVVSYSGPVVITYGSSQ